MRKVIRFGGTSISHVEGLNKVLEIIQSQQYTEQLSIVISAFAGQTDLLTEYHRSKDKN